jgi:hypothetical protein
MILEFAPVLHFDILEGTEQQGRYIIVKKGLGFLVFDIDTYKNKSVMYKIKLVTLITENLYADSQKKLSKEIFKEIPQNNLVLICHDRFDIDWENLIIRHINLDEYSN